MIPANNAGSNVFLKDKQRERLAKHVEAFLGTGGSIYQAEPTENKISKPSRNLFGIGFNRHQVKEIRRRLKDGQAPHYIAQVYGVAIERIENIAKGDSYKDVK